MDKKMHVFYIMQPGGYYKVGIVSDNKDGVQSHLESLSKEVRYKGLEEAKPSRYGTKKIKRGELFQYKYYGSVCPCGLSIDRRYHRA